MNSNWKTITAACLIIGLVAFNTYVVYQYRRVGKALKVDSLFLPGQDVVVSFKIKNVGNMVGKEVPLLFINDEVSSVVTPMNLLKGFEKIQLKPGEEKIVEMVIPYKQLGLWNTDMKYVVEPGRFIVKIGRSVGDIRLKGSFEVISVPLKWDELNN